MKSSLRNRLMDEIQSLGFTEAQFITIDKEEAEVILDVLILLDDMTKEAGLTSRRNNLIPPSFEYDEQKLRDRAKALLNKLHR